MQRYTIHLFLENYSTCFGLYLHPSSGAHTAVFTAFGTCQTITAICRYLGRVGTGLSVVWEFICFGAVATAPKQINFHTTLKAVPTLPR
jgi:hypothetical protein